MKANVGMKYILIEAEGFGSLITADNGRLWRPELKTVEFIAIDRSIDEPGVFFDVGGEILEKFEFTDANDILSLYGKRYIVLTPAFFKEQKENT